MYKPTSKNGSYSLYRAAGRALALGTALYAITPNVTYARPEPNKNEEAAQSQPAQGQPAQGSGSAIANNMKAAITKKGKLAEIIENTVGGVVTGLMSVLRGVQKEVTTSPEYEKGKEVIAKYTTSEGRQKAYVEENHKDFEEEKEETDRVIAKLRSYGLDVEGTSASKPKAQSKPKAKPAQAAPAAQPKPTPQPKKDIWDEMNDL